MGRHGILHGPSNRYAVVWGGGGVRPLSESTPSIETDFGEHKGTNNATGRLAEEMVLELHLQLQELVTGVRSDFWHVLCV